MGIFKNLFAKNEKEKETEKPTAKQPTVPTEMLMSSQYPALYLKENNSTYRDMYMENLSGIGFSRGDAEKLFDFECGVIRKHAKAYLQHPQLRANLLEISGAMLALDCSDALMIMDGYTDEMKLRSSMTLFAEAQPDCEVFQQVLDKFFGGKKDNYTLSILKHSKSL